MLRHVGYDAVTNKLSVMRSCLQMPCYYVALSEMEVLEVLQLGVLPRQGLLFSSTCSLKILLFLSSSTQSRLLCFSLTPASTMPSLATYYCSHTTLFPPMMILLLLLPLLLLFKPPSLRSLSCGAFTLELVRTEARHDWSGVTLCMISRHCTG